MPHLRFNLHDSHGPLPDPEGAQFVDFEEARNQAVRGIRSVLSEEVLSGLLDLTGRMEIVDEAGAVVGIVRFDEVLDVVQNPRAQ